MEAGDGELILKKEVYVIVGCAMEVLNHLGHGLNEKPYERSLAVEFGLRQIPFKQQARFDVLYKGVTAGEYVPDLIVFDQVVTDSKCVTAITDHELGQMMNYLRITGLKVGVILKFQTRQTRMETRHPIGRPQARSLSSCFIVIRVHWCSFVVVRVDSCQMVIDLPFAFARFCDSFKGLVNEDVFAED